jgi:hypothetical protein
MVNPQCATAPSAAPAHVAMHRITICHLPSPPHAASAAHAVASPKYHFFVFLPPAACRLHHHHIHVILIVTGVLESIKTLNSAYGALIASWRRHKVVVWWILIIINKSVALLRNVGVACVLYQRLPLSAGTNSHSTTTFSRTWRGASWNTEEVNVADQSRY